MTSTSSRSDYCKYHRVTKLQNHMTTMLIHNLDSNFGPCLVENGSYSSSLDDCNS